MTMPVRARWRAVPRAVRWPVLAVVALYAAYLLLGNLFLNTPLGTAALNRTPDRFAMQWRAGLTWWPGRLTLWDVNLHGRTTRSRWEASADRLHGQVRLLPLLHRQLLVPELHAQGVRGGLHASDLPGAVVVSPAPASSSATATASSATATATTTNGVSAPRTSQADGMPVDPAATNAANASNAAAGEAPPLPLQPPRPTQPPRQPRSRQHAPPAVKPTPRVDVAVRSHRRRAGAGADTSPVTNRR